MKFNYADQADILRAYQKDDSAIELLKNYYLQSIEMFQGRCKSRLRNCIELVGVCYYLSTSACNLQTLGEEYMGLLRYHNKRRNIPKLQDHLLWITLYFYGDTIIASLLNKYTFRSNSIIKNFLNLLTSFHRLIFFYNGDYLHLSDRLTSLQYILIKNWPRNTQLKFLFHLMSFLLLFSLIIKIKAMKIDKSFDRNDFLKTEQSNQSEGHLCVLCTEINEWATSLTCGHIFCWKCVENLRQNSNQCPICRQFFQPNRTVILQNF